MPKTLSPLAQYLLRREEERVRAESREEGRELTMLEVLRNSMQSLQVSSQRAMEILGVPMEEREKYRKKLGDLT